MTRESITTLLNATRLAGLETTEGGRILATISRPDLKGTAYRTALVEIVGEQIVPLTRGASSVGAVAAAEDGTTFFTSQRVGEDGEDASDAQLWALPVRGEARELAARPGGFGGLQLAGGRLIAELSVHTQAADETEHARLSTQREDAKVTGVLHAGFPTRHWDHDLGPSRSVLAIAALPEDLDRAERTAAPEAQGESAAGSGAAGAAAGATAAPAAGPAAESSGAAASPGAGGDAAQDGSDDKSAASTQVLHFRHVAMPPGRLVGWTVDRQGERALVAMSDSHHELLAVTNLYLVDLLGAQPPRLLRESTRETDYGPGEFSPDGTRALIGRSRTWTQENTLASMAEILDLASGDSTQLWPELDHWIDPVWLDDSTLVAASDDQGRGSLWIGGADDPAPLRLAGGPQQELAFGEVTISGGAVITTASGISRAPHPVRIDPATGTVENLPNPADAVEQTGALTEVTATAADGTEVRAWLRLPDGEGPHPLVVFAHGGPWGSWNAWTYRWNPGPFVAAGYAVLLPDPAISTGYGQSMIDRGQHELGGAPYTDIMALTDQAVARADIDAERTAFAGGSYGGYMANWVAGHTGDRFRCIVTHASLWDTESMGSTTDNAAWERPMREQNQRYNPKDHVAAIEVPMLVIHGDKDYRVPIAQGHALWYDLHEFSATPRDAEGRTRHRYLYFPDEGHWIAGRGNAQVWYETFLGFLDEHVKGEAWQAPATLG